MRTFALISIVLAAAAPNLVLALDNGVGRTPPMGWLSWERYRCVTDCKTYPDSCINENLYMTMADALVKGGFADVGYVYVNVDDCWSAMQRNAQGQLVGDPVRFPHGMKALGDYIHSQGLRFGIYNDVGTKTCGGYPGAEGHNEVDAKTYASWGVDSLKLDGCNANRSDYATAYPAMGRALNQTGRPILYSCSWPAYIGTAANYSLIAESCNLWRAYRDVQDSWASVLGIIEWWDSQQSKLIAAAQPGAVNDPDMIIVGDFGLSLDQAQTQMALWSIYAAPLYLSSDIRDGGMAADMKAIVTNPEVIAINQDPLVKEGRQVLNGTGEAGTVRVYHRQLNGGDAAVAAFYESTAGSATAYTLNITAALEGLPLPRVAGGAVRYYSVRDVVARQDLGVFSSTMDIRINPHGTRMFRISAPK